MKRIKNKVIQLDLTDTSLKQLVYYVQCLLGQLSLWTTAMKRAMKRIIVPRNIQPQMILSGKISYCQADIWSCLICTLCSTLYISLHLDGDELDIKFPIKALNILLPNIVRGNINNAVFHYELNNSTLIVFTIANVFQTIKL